MSDTSAPLARVLGEGTVAGTEAWVLEGGAGVEDPEYLSRQLIT